MEDGTFLSNLVSLQDGTNIPYLLLEICAIWLCDHKASYYFGATFC